MYNATKEVLELYNNLIDVFKDTLLTSAAELKKTFNYQTLTGLIQSYYEYKGWDMTDEENKYHANYADSLKFDLDKKDDFEKKLWLFNFEIMTANEMFKNRENNPFKKLADLITKHGYITFDGLT